MEPLLSFTLVDPEFFEPLGRYEIGLQYKDTLRGLLPAQWSVQRGDLWLMAHSEGIEIPPQGFKIHVSGTVANAEEVLRRVVPECVAERTSFKVIADPTLLLFAGSKNFGRGSSSKFITTYPPNQATFERLIETLHQRTKDLDGPYILSDMRYKDSRVVFYRYGGMQRMHVMTVTGARDPVILKPDGQPVPDDRLPFYQLPEWVSDPFGNRPVTDYDDTHVLNERYEIEAALSFSNRGGVYRARDLSTGRTVIVKEARPCTATWVRGSDFVDAVDLLRREFAILRSLQELEFLPEAIDLFTEWEHVFLVEQFLEGRTLTRYRARSDVALIPFTGEQARKRNFCRIFKRIAVQLVAAVEQVHGRGVLIGDLSPGNVIIDPDTLRIHLIDLESAYFLADADTMGGLSAVWATPGFATRNRLRRDRLTPEDDHYALGMLLYSLITPVQTLFDLEPTATERVLSRIDESVGLPSEVPAVIFSLLEGDVAKTKRTLQRWKVAESVRRHPAPSRGDFADVESELELLARRIAEYVLSTTDLERTDRLWPADINALQTNPLSLAYGACGTLLFLQDVLGCAPAEAEHWVLQRQIAPHSYPPGLYVGTAGVALALLELGHEEKAMKVLGYTYESSLRFNDPTMFHGVAGWGLASLSLHQATGHDRCLTAAVEAGEHLLSTEELRSEGSCWRNSVDQQVHYGFAFGASGIALFLLYLHQATGEQRFLECARRGVAFETESAMDFSGKPKWVRFEGDLLTEPYWLHGAAGVGSTLIRFHHHLGDEMYLRLAESAADAAFSKFAVLPSQFEGLSGIGELMLDMYQFTGRNEYRIRALELVQSILSLRIERPAGLAFPGRLLLRISTDFGYGSAGVGAFFHRLASRGPRWLHDLAGIGVSSSLEGV